MTSRIRKSLREFVRRRASHRCEYCLLHESCSSSPHEPDHVVAKKHGGKSTRRNLAWACAFCNGCKGTDLAAVDPRSLRSVFLFNPRKDHWKDHFQLRGAYIEPLTARGRATAFLLQFNHVDNVNFRRALIQQGLYP
jgi:5-methylcytosine-specific restriction endonuclease McrA